MISDFALLDATNGFSYVYEFADNYNGYTWSDGTPTVAVTNTTTGVWAYGFPAAGSGFQISAPADTTVRTLKVYVGAFAASGKLEASLSDNSAAAYSGSFTNQSNGESRAYSITYAAQSPGQTLTVKWTLSRQVPSHTDGNVTLQAAALGAPGANNPPTVTLASPGDNTTFPAGSNIAVSANAVDPDGDVTLVEFFAGATKIGEAVNSPFGSTWSNVPAGDYVLTARATDSGGASAVSGPVEIFVNGTGGSLAGATALPSAAVDLTAEGTADWAHWGLSSPTSFDHKAGVSQQISTYVEIGTAIAQQFSDNFTAYSWADGTPTASTNGTRTGVFIQGLANGFMLTAPAGNDPRTLKVYVGLYGVQGKFQAYLSDFSAPAYTDASPKSVYGNAYAVYAINYTSASASQRIIVLAATSRPWPEKARTGGWTLLWQRQDAPLSERTPKITVSHFTTSVIFLACWRSLKNLMVCPP